MESREVKYRGRIQNGSKQRKKRGQDILLVWEVGPHGQKLLGEEQSIDNRNTTEVGKRQWRTVSS